MVGIMPLLRRSDANSRYNVKPATGDPDHRAANSEKEATLTKQANDFRGKIFSREDIFARRLFSREDIFAGTVNSRKYLLAKIFQIHLSRNFPPAKIKCYTVYDFRLGNNVFVTSQLVFTSHELVKKKAARVGEWLATFTLFPLSPTGATSIDNDVV